MGSHGLARVVVGLGNPGTRYAGTRHNIGFMVVDGLARQWSAPWSSNPDGEPTSLIARAKARSEKVLLVKPQTYMNRSGRALLALSRESFDFGDLLIVLDDFNLDFGRVRLRAAGGDGGHNGLASVIDAMGTEEIPRVRLGIGQVPEEDVEIDYVLTSFEPGEDVEGLVRRGCEAVTSCISEGIDAAMNRFNGYPPL